MFESLTERQKQVVELISRGFTAQEVAEHLGVSLSTINFHKKRIYKALNIKSKHQLVVWCYKNKWGGYGEKTSGEI